MRYFVRYLFLVLLFSLFNLGSGLLPVADTTANAQTTLTLTDAFRINGEGGPGLNSPDIRLVFTVSPATTFDNDAIMVIATRTDGTKSDNLFPNTGAFNVNTNINVAAGSSGNNTDDSNDLDIRYLLSITGNFNLAVAATLTTGQAGISAKVVGDDIEIILGDIPHTVVVDPNAPIVSITREAGRPLLRSQANLFFAIRVTDPNDNLDTGTVDPTDFVLIEVDADGNPTTNPPSTTVTLPAPVPPHTTNPRYHAGASNIDDGISFLLRFELPAPTDTTGRYFTVGAAPSPTFDIEDGDDNSVAVTRSVATTIGLLTANPVPEESIIHHALPSATNLEVTDITLLDSVAVGTRILNTSTTAINFLVSLNQNVSSLSRTPVAADFALTIGESLLTDPNTTGITIPDQAAFTLEDDQLVVSVTPSTILSNTLRIGNLILDANPSSTLRYSAADSAGMFLVPSSVTAEHVILLGIPDLTIVRSSSIQDNNPTGISVGGTVRWFLNFGDSEPDNVDIQGESSQFEVRALMPDGTTVDTSITPLNVMVTDDPTTGRFQVETTLQQASDSTTITYGVFTKSDYTPALSHGTTFDGAVVAANTHLTTNANQRFVNLPATTTPITLTLTDAFRITGEGTANDRAPDIRLSFTLSSSASIDNSAFSLVGTLQNGNSTGNIFDTSGSFSDNTSTTVNTAFDISSGSSAMNTAPSNDLDIRYLLTTTGNINFVVASTLSTGQAGISALVVGDDIEIILGDIPHTGTTTPTGPIGTRTECLTTNAVATGTFRITDICRVERHSDDSFTVIDAGIPDITTATTLTWIMEFSHGAGVLPSQNPLTINGVDSATITYRKIQADGTVVGTASATSNLVLVTAEIPANPTFTRPATQDIYFDITTRVSFIGNAVGVLPTDVNPIPLADFQYTVAAPPPPPVTRTRCLTTEATNTGTFRISDICRVSRSGDTNNSFTLRNAAIDYPTTATTLTWIVEFSHNLGVTSALGTPLTLDGVSGVNLTYEKLNTTGVAPSGTSVSNLLIVTAVIPANPTFDNTDRNISFTVTTPSAFIGTGSLASTLPASSTYQYTSAEPPAAPRCHTSNVLTTGTPVITDICRVSRSGNTFTAVNSPIPFPLTGTTLTWIIEFSRGVGVASGASPLTINGVDGVDSATINYEKLNSDGTVVGADTSVTSNLVIVSVAIPANPTFTRPATRDIYFEIANAGIFVGLNGGLSTTTNPITTDIFHFVSAPPPLPARIDSFEPSGVDFGNRRQTFIVTFSRAVMGLSTGNFSATDDSSSSLTTTVMSVSPDSGSATTFTITTTTDGTTDLDGVIVTLSLDDLNNVDIATGTGGVVTALTSARTQMQTFRDLATAPLITSVSASDSSLTSGTITWTITFNQAVIGVSSSNFRVVSSPSTTGITIVSSSLSPQNGEGSTFMLSATIPDSGVDSSTSISLGLSGSASSIMGSLGATSASDSTPIRRPLSTSASHNLTSTTTVLNDARFVSFSRGEVNQELGTQTFTITFSRSVMGLSASNFSATDTINPPSTSTTVTGVSSGPSETFTITTTTTGAESDRTSSSVTLTLENLDNVVVASSSTGLVTMSLSTPPPSVTQEFLDIEEVMESFMELSLVSVERQATQIITNTPALSTRLTRTSTSGPRSIIDDSNQNFTADVSNDYSMMHYTSNYVSPLSSGVDSNLLGSAEFWTNLTYSTSELESGSESTSFYSTTGIDFVNSRGAIWGLLMQLDMSDESQASRVDPFNPSSMVKSELESFGWLTGPYVVYESDGFSLSGRAAIGASSADITPSPSASGEYDTERYLLSLGANGESGRFLGFSHWSYSPSISYTYYREKLSDYTLSSTTTTTPIVIPATDYDLNRLELGHLFSRDYIDSGEGVLTPSVGLTAIYDTSSTDVPSTSSGDLDNLKARLSTSIIYGGPSGIDWNASLYYEGIGQDNNTKGLSLGLSINY